MKIKKEMKKWKNFFIFSLVLAIFFVLSYFHEWANDFFINLHFCNHTLCTLFSIVWFAFAFFAWQNKKSYINSALIVLVIGIILMNLVICDIDGSMSLGPFEFSQFSSKVMPITVPIPPCEDTDGGRDYITYGIIRSGADVEDICMGDTLRERYCVDELTYTSEDIDCKTRYGADWICEEGECRESETPIIPESEDCYDECENVAYRYCVEHAMEGTDEFDYCMDSLDDEIEECRELCDAEEVTEENTLALCTDEIDNDGDTLIDCDDIDCAEFCECAHDCDPVTGCFGYCSWDMYGYEGYCAVYNTLTATWCECVPDGEVPCGEVDGWCQEGDMCVPTPEGDYVCIYDYGNPCYESDGGNMPTVGGYCYSFDDSTFYYDECEKFYNIVMEMWCTDLGCTVAQGFCDDWGFECTIDSAGDYCGEMVL